MPRKTELSEADKALRNRLGASIRAASVKAGVKPAELAATAGVSLAHQYRVEAGEQTPDFLYLFKVAARLGTTIDGLLAGVGIPADARQPVSIKVSSKHGHAAGRDVNVNMEKTNGKGHRSQGTRSGA